MISIIITGWEQAISWIVLFFILYSVVSDKIRIEAAAFGGLLLLGLLRIASPANLFSGFVSPALFTVGIVMVMSAGIVESGILLGLGKSIAKRIHKPKKQIMALFLTTSFISAFMNNVGAIGIMLPTSKRMAQRAGIDKAQYGMPLAFASILGGSMTLIGTASNLIVSTFRFQAFGEPFRMFDFAPHGLMMISTGIIVLFLCQVCGLNPLQTCSINKDGDNSNVRSLPPEVEIKRNTHQSVLVFISLLLAVVFTSIGWIHPAIGFGSVIMLWISTAILPSKIVYEHINLPILLFLGCMLSISNILQDTGALQTVVKLIIPLVSELSPFLLILLFLFMTALISNLLDNSVSAVLMAPFVIQLHQSIVMNVSVDALLMAVAAGASLGIVVPTHQATLLAMNDTGFSRKCFMKTGFLITIAAGLLATLIIRWVWV